MRRREFITLLGGAAGASGRGRSRRARSLGSDILVRPLPPVTPNTAKHFEMAFVGSATVSRAQMSSSTSALPRKTLTDFPLSRRN